MISRFTGNPLVQNEINQHTNGSDHWALCHMIIKLFEFCSQQQSEHFMVNYCIRPCTNWTPVKLCTKLLAQTRWKREKEKNKSVSWKWAASFVSVNLILGIGGKYIQRGLILKIELKNRSLEIPLSVTQQN